MYNRYKGGVDRADQCQKTFSCQRKTKRWPLATYMNFVDLCVHNCFLMFVAANPIWQEKNHRKKPLFLTWLAKDLAISHVRDRQQNQNLTRATQELLEVFIQDYEKNYTTCSCCAHLNTDDIVQCAACKVSVCSEHRRSISTYLCSNCPLSSSITERPPKRGRCYICCSQGARSKDKKTSTFCNACHRTVCMTHRQQVEHTVCMSCTEKFT